MTKEQAKQERKVMRQITTILVIMIGIMTITTILAATAAWLSVSRSLINTVTIEQRSIEPQHAVLCPGQTFSLTYQIKTYKVPSIVTIYENWRSDTLGYNVVLEADPVHSIISVAEDFTRTAVISVPLSLSPGHYAYVRAAQEDGSPVSILSIPVLVTGCP